MSSGGGSPVRLTHVSGDRNPLLFSRGMEPKVLFEENSWLRATGDEQAAAVQKLEARIKELATTVRQLEDEKLTARGTGVPKVDLHEIRERMTVVSEENFTLRRERDAANARNIGLTAEIRRLQEACMGKDTLLTARGRTLDRNRVEMNELQRQLVEIKERCKELDVLGAPEQSPTHRWEDEVMRGVEAEYRKEISALRKKVEELERERERPLVDRDTYDGWDEVAREMEANYKDQITTLKTELAAARKHEAHAHAAVRVAHTHRRYSLTHQETSARLEIELSYHQTFPVIPTPPSSEIHHLLESHLAAFKYLGEEFKKSRVLFKQRLLEEIRTLLDKAYEDGYKAGLGKGKGQNQSMLSEVSDTTHTSTHSSADNMQLFETVLRRSPATEIASALARCGLKVVPSPTPRTT
eukprot:TRINITY_DN37816_c0_g1_i1.p1 TRINITY_DN37816_c0_g1~~TRINITY_DN37816_c0_g1_i1.p1  ORF type:complete len:412 (+),score=48.78 TRINITY_DN37816_c0_g1_i1:70-1305(+)